MLLNKFFVKSSKIRLIPISLVLVNIIFYKNKNYYRKIQNIINKWISNGNLLKDGGIWKVQFN